MIPAGVRDAESAPEGYLPEVEGRSGCGGIWNPGPTLGGAAPKAGTAGTPRGLSEGSDKNQNCAESPQAHVPLAFGLLIVKPDCCNEST